MGDTETAKLAPEALISKFQVNKLLKQGMPAQAPQCEERN